MASETYTYDAVGNRLTANGSPPASYDPANRLTSDAGHTYVYDNDGNLLSVRDASGTTSYTWNAAHQLLGITFADGSTASFLYDPIGRRVEATIQGQTARYVYNGMNPAYVYDGSNTLTESFVNGVSLDAVFEQTQNGQRFFPLTDGSNNVVALTNIDGNAVANYTYSAFGVQTSTGSASSAFTYGSRELDLKSGLYFLRSR